MVKNKSNTTNDINDSAMAAAKAKLASMHGKNNANIEQAA